jgi:hypothetical protein
MLLIHRRKAFTFINSAANYRASHIPIFYDQLR